MMVMKMRQASLLVKEQEMNKDLISKEMAEIRKIIREMQINLSRVIKQRQHSGAWKRKK